VTEEHWSADEPRPITEMKILDERPPRVWDEGRPLTGRKLVDGDLHAAEWRDLEARVRELEERLRGVEERLS